MSKIWNITQTICHRYSISKITTFLVLNTLFWGIIFLMCRDIRDDRRRSQDF